MFPLQSGINLPPGIGKYPEVWFSLGPTISSPSTTTYTSSLCVRVRIGMDVEWNERKRTVEHEEKERIHILNPLLIYNADQSSLIISAWPHSGT